MTRNWETVQNEIETVRQPDGGENSPAGAPSLLRSKRFEENTDSKEDCEMPVNILTSSV